MKKLIMVVLVGALVWTGINFYNSQQEVKKLKEEKTVKEKDKKLEAVPEPGFKAPNITLKDFNGTVHSLSDAKGKPYIINFWASWCGPCEVEAPDLVHLYEKYNGQIEIFAVNATLGDSVEGAKQFAERHKFQFPVLLDMDGVAGVAYKVVSLPTTYFVDKDGVIVDRVIGVLPPEELEKKFQQLIEG
ncbi:thiol:disulfide interchange protein [Bacillus manliponensis]|uniref:Thiol:disulfide interchange protein n=1 Tax=Bacillus manliponensis TaxID=574376 RepID=A0A073K2I0_9BACI|nr:TlpA disulfide reductase family protein [Bacillus manliponensis]KEK20710.1 thiol:disulfide interchange protein [Bacillus manliponensis]